MKANPRAVALYLGMIGFSVLCFSAIASYGSTHLRAPRAIGGQYALAEPTSPCFSAPPLLVLGQSGSYLGADLIPHDAGKNLRNRALKGNGHLHGEIEAGRFLLTGTTRLGHCPQPQKIALEATVEADGRLSGTVSLDGRTLPLAGQRKSD
jgi:hypothetical protein